jgi:hypothetical protein
MPWRLVIAAEGLVDTVRLKADELGVHAYDGIAQQKTEPAHFRFVFAGAISLQGSTVYYMSFSIITQTD